MKSYLILGAIAAAGTISPIAYGQYNGVNLPEGYVQVQGDIITTKERAERLFAEMRGEAVQPQFVYYPSRLWPNRIVPYDFGPGVTGQQQTFFLAAMALWTNSFPGVTTITFQPRNGEAGYLHLVVGDPGGFCGGAADDIGYNGGNVTLTVSNCAISNIGLIAHELGHALGLWHEQSRNDRDSYVTIVTANIQSGQASQFAKASPQSTFGQYDYDSIMHYFACSFSVCPSCGCLNTNCVAIQVASPYDTTWQCSIGQRDHLSAMDKRSMGFMYGPPTWKFLYAKSGSSANGSFQQPYTSAAQAAGNTPANSTLWLGPGSYSAAGVTFSTPMTLKAALPDLQLQANGSLGPSSSGYATLQ